MAVVTNVGSVSGDLFKVTRARNFTVNIELSVLTSGYTLSLVMSLLTSRYWQSLDCSDLDISVNIGIIFNSFDEA